MAPQFRICDYIYPFDPTVGITGSSEDPSYPASNLASHQRSKPWRSYGTFVITTNNNKLDFVDTASASVTATLTNGTYTPETLAVEIVRAMAAASTHGTFACSFSRLTGRWTISTSTGATFALSGTTGANTLVSVLPSIGFPSTTTDYTGALTYTGPIIAIHTHESIVFDLRTWLNNPVDTFGMLFDPTDGIKFSESAVITLQANQTNTWSSPAVAQVLSFNQNFDNLYYFFSSAQNYRYWRIKIVDTANPNLYVEIPLVVLSYATQLSQMPHTGFKSIAVDRSVPYENAYGNQFYDIYPSQRAWEFSWTMLPEADKQSLYQIYNRLGKSTPLAIFLDPTQTIFSDAGENFIFGRFTNDWQADQNFTTYFDETINIQEAL